MTPPSRWLPYRRPRATPPALRLFCFPNAGGAASMFRRWTHDSLPAAVEVCPIQLPGRESRLREAPFTRVAPLIDTLEREIRAHLDLPFVFFGHSMGATVSYELTQRLVTRGGPLPARLIVAGRRAPHVPDENEPVHTMADAALIQRLRDYGGTPSEILDNREIMKLVLPTIRADFEVIETHAFSPRAPLPMPITVLGGETDADTPPAHLEAWSEHTDASCGVQMFSGGHFFLHEQPEPTLAFINEVLVREVAAV